MPKITLTLSSRQGKATKSFGTDDVPAGDHDALATLLKRELRAFTEYAGQPDAINIDVQDFHDMHTSTGYRDNPSMPTGGSSVSHKRELMGR